jgi:hypothetical protein
MNYPLSKEAIPAPFINTPVVFPQLVEQLHLPSFPQEHKIFLQAESLGRGIGEQVASSFLKLVRMGENRMHFPFSSACSPPLPPGFARCSQDHPAW